MSYRFGWLFIYAPQPDDVCISHLVRRRDSVRVGAELDGPADQSVSARIEIAVAYVSRSHPHDGLRFFRYLLSDRDNESDDDEHTRKRADKTSRPVVP